MKFNIGTGNSISALLTAALLQWGAIQADAEVHVARIFGSHMVLQQDKPIAIWGWANPGETINLTMGDEKQQVKATDRGEWKASLQPRKAGGPFTLKVSGSSEVLFEDVLVGEVWLASGQSNMEMGIGMAQDGKNEIAAADHPQIRLFMVQNRWKPEPQADLEASSDGKHEGSWQVCSPETVGQGGWGGFSAAAYFFGRELQRELKVPVGLIDATWGGTRIESWTPPEGFAQVPALKGEYERVQLGDCRTELHRQRLEKTLQQTETWVREARAALEQKAPVPPMPAYPQELLPPKDLQTATALYNGMIHPLQPFALRGIIWYQGESNSSEGRLYTERMKALVEGWRRVWNDESLAFYYVQIAPFNYQGDATRIGEFWEAQAAAEAIPNTGMVVINDIGNLKDIHPRQKQEVGRRLACWALARQYARSNLVYQGPTFKAMDIKGGELRVSFENTAGGLASRDGKPLNWFEIIDAKQGGWVPADARVEGDAVVLSSPEVKQPVAMRFAWSMLAEPNLQNAAGLPAGAFRAGTVPKRDLLEMQVPEARQYKTVLDLDLSKLGPVIRYESDQRGTIKNGFDRVAYFVELQGSDGRTQFVYASMSAFTTSLEQIGIPTAASGAHFQQPVAAVNVLSNVRGIATGTNLPGCNIEFWPNNYGPANSANVLKASSQVFDFGDQPTEPLDGYGSMQLHNAAAKQTLFAINHWREGNKADVGIGNQATGNPDWTFAANADSRSAKRLRVLVRPK